MYGEESEEDIGNLQPKNTSPSIQMPRNKPPSPRHHPEYSHPDIDLTWPSAWPRNPLLPFKLDGTGTVEAPFFVQHLRITCLYQGFLVLKNQSVPLNALRRPFRLLLSLVTRETITSFFYACLYARLNNDQPDRWNEIPFFKLGGAGTHYPEAFSSSQSETETRGPEQQHFSLENHALSAFSPEAQEELDGDWFDIWDLAGYLQAERISLSTAPPTENTTHRKVNALDFTAGKARLS